MNNRKILLLMCLQLCVTTACAESNVYYVSTTDGKDGNNGLSIHSPVARVSDIKQKDGVIVRLKCGDVFFENISGFKNSTIESYGKGEKPVLCGFKVLKNAEAWKYDNTKRLWILDLEEQNNFVGIKATGFENNIGCIYDSRKNKLYGRLLDQITDLKADGDFYTSSVCDSKVAKAEDFHFLYLRYSGNPATLGNLCFATRKSGVASMTNCTIKDIAVVGYAVHGMCALNKCTVENCDLDIIGGAIQIGKCPWVRFGNGIEFYITNNPIGNTMVSGCRISRTFDCGATIQGTGDAMGDAKNIRFTNNHFVYCRQAFEHFMQSNGNPALYVNCMFDNNLVFMMGDNQFCCPEIRDAAVLSYELQDKSCNIMNNTFYGSNYYFGNKLPDGMTGNTVYIYPDQYLHHSHFREDKYPVLYANDGLKAYRERTNDKSVIRVVDRGSIADWWYKRKFSKQIGLKKPELHLERILKQ